MYSRGLLTEGCSQPVIAVRWWQNFPEVGPSVKKLGHYGNALGGDSETPVLLLQCLCLHGSLMTSLNPHHIPLTGSLGLLRAESNRATQS